MERFSLKKLRLRIKLLLSISTFLILGITGFIFFQANKFMPSLDNFVEGFFKHYNKKDYSYLYNVTADKDFKGNIGGGDFEKLMHGIYDRLGEASSWRKVNWRLSYLPKGLFFYLTYKVKHKNSETIEGFVLKNNKNNKKDWSLYSYSISSEGLF